MSRAASSTLRTEEIQEKLISSNCKAEMKIEYWNGSAWVEIEDVDGQKGIQISKSSKGYKYANYGLTPLASTITFNVLSKDGEYSEGSGTSKVGIIDLDTKIRVQGGYVVEDYGETATATIDLNDSNAFFYYTTYNGTYVTLSPSTKTDTDTYFTDLFASKYNDGGKYGDGGKYAPGGYYLTTYDIGTKDYKTLTLTVNCNSTAGTIYYRTYNDTDILQQQTQSVNWENGGSTANGDVEVEVNSKQRRYVQIAILWDGITWDTDVRINSISFTYELIVEYLYKEVFYLDTPVYVEPKAPAMPYVQCSGRDIIKRAIENEINLQNVNGQTIDEIIKNVCDIVGIGYTDDSIVDLSSFGVRTLTAGYADTNTDKKLPKAIQIFENCMQIINKTGFDYRMYVEYDEDVDDNILFVKPAPTSYAVDFVFNYKHYTAIGNQRKNYDKLLKRFTVISDQQAVAAETQLSSQTYTTTGTKTLSWSGNAIYKRFEITRETGDASTIEINEVNNTNIKFDITGSSVNVVITVFGNKWNAQPTYKGEWIDYDNMVGNKGNTTRIVNPLVISDDECRDIAHGQNDNFGDPVDESKDLNYPFLNLLLEQNDMCLVWSRYLFRDNLRFITGMTYKWTKFNDSCSFNLDDSGLNFSDEGSFVYDRDKAPIDGSVIRYDKGWLYDMEEGPGATAAEIDANTVLVHNVGTI